MMPIFVLVVLTFAACSGRQLPEIPKSIYEDCENGAYCWIRVEAGSDKSQLEVAGAITNWSSKTIQSPSEVLDVSYLYTGRAAHLDGHVSGAWSTYDNSHHLFFAYDGVQIAKEEFEVIQFTHGALSWVEKSDGGLPTDAIVAGLYPETHEVAYVCRAIHKDNLLIGVLRTSTSKCSVPHMSYAHDYPEYEVLAVNHYGRWLLNNNTMVGQ